MKFTAEETSWITDRLNWYDIPYQEIFNEIADHIITAIETKREEGDTRDVKLIFQQVVDEHFGGFMGIEKIAKEQEVTYRKKVRSQMWLNLKEQLNWPGKMFVAIMFIIGFYLPHNKLIMIVLLSTIVLVVFYTWLKTQWQLRFIKTVNNKKSLVGTFVLTQSFLPMIIFSAVTNIPNTLGHFTNNPKFVFKLFNYHPTILTTLLALNVVYSVACMRLSKQELKFMQHDTDRKRY